MKKCPGRGLKKKEWLVGWVVEHDPASAVNLQSINNFKLSWLGCDGKGKPWPNTWEPAGQVLKDSKTSSDLFGEILRYASESGLLKDGEGEEVRYSTEEIEKQVDLTFTRYKYWSRVVRPFSSKQNPRAPLKSENIPR